MFSADKCLDTNQIAIRLVTPIEFVTGTEGEERNLTTQSGSVIILMQWHLASFIRKR